LLALNTCARLKGREMFAFRINRFAVRGIAIN